MKTIDLSYSPLWNLLLITAGSVLFAVGAKGIVIHHNFLISGLFGTGLLIYYTTGWLSPGVWFLLLNLPLFAASWFFVSRRFFLYSLYAMGIVTLSYELLELNFNVHQQLYAAIAGGIVCGAGGGLILRSLGSGGGLDLIAVILNQKYNLGIGKFYMIYNAGLFSFGLWRMDVDLVIASLIMVFITSVTVDYMLALFSQRKIVYVISDKTAAISREVMDNLNSGATFIKAKGAYSGKDQDILMTISNNIQLKRLEEAVFQIDPQALFIVENTFNVIGSSFSKRKIY